MERLRRLTREDLARLTLVECLDECNRGDVVVVRPAPGRRRAGTTPVWFERLAGDRATGALATWLREGGPSAGPPPAQLAHLVINRPGPGDDDQSAVRSAQSTTTTT